MLFNSSIQPDLAWDYNQVLEWLENNLEIHINPDNHMDLSVYFTPFPPGVLGYIAQHNNKRSLRDQIVILVCKTHDNGKSKRFKKLGSYRTYTIPVPQQYKSAQNYNIYRKNWRILPITCARDGQYAYHNFWDPKTNYLGIYARDLGGDTKHDCYMVAIALANKGRLTDYIWFSSSVNKVKMDKLKSIE